MATQLSREKAAQAWCKPTTSNKVMDVELAEAFAEILDEISKWKPIETAPKDTPILVTDGKVIVVLERGESAGDDWPCCVGFSGYAWEWDFEWRDLTYWMPLPEFPNKVLIS